MGFKYGALLLIVISCSVLGQRRIDGKIIDSKSGEPISFVSIGIVGTSRGTSANGEGEFSILISEHE